MLILHPASRFGSKIFYPFLHRKKTVLHVDCLSTCVGYLLITSHFIFLFFPCLTYFLYWRLWKNAFLCHISSSSTSSTFSSLPPVYTCLFFCSVFVIETYKSYTFIAFKKYKNTIKKMKGHLHSIHPFTPYKPCFSFEKSSLCMGQKLKSSTKILISFTVYNLK